MTPTFFTDRLTLRPTIEADAPAIQQRFADYEVIRWLSRGVPWPYPEGAALQFIREQILPNQGRDRWTWSLHLHDEEGAIGVVDLWREGRPEHRGFWLGRAFWGLGLMTEALAPITDYAFDALGFEELILNNARDNRRSHNVKAGSGAELIEVRPGAFVDPSLTEAEIWRLTKAAWRARG